MFDYRREFDMARELTWDKVIEACSWLQLVLSGQSLPA